MLFWAQTEKPYQIALQRKLLAVLDWLPQPRQLFSQLPKSMRLSLTVTYQTSATQTDPAANSKSIGLRAHSSVNHVGKIKISKKGNRRIRCILYMPSLVSVRLIKRRAVRFKESVWQVSLSIPRVQFDNWLNINV